MTFITKFDGLLERNKKWKCFDTNNYIEIIIEFVIVLENRKEKRRKQFEGWFQMSPWVVGPKWVCLVLMERWSDGGMEGWESPQIRLFLPSPHPYASFSLFLSTLFLPNKCVLKKYFILLPLFLCLIFTMNLFQ